MISKRISFNGGFALILGCVIAGLIFLVYRGSAPFVDEGSFCTISQGILEGKLPYQDYFNEKPPLQYFWTASVMYFVGIGIDGARIASSITLALALAFSLASLSQRTKNLFVVVVWAAALTVIGLSMKIFNNTSESSLAMLNVISAILVLKTDWDHPARQGFVVGFIQGVACGFRQHAVITAIVLLFMPWHKSSRIFYLLGFFVGLFVWVAVLFSLNIFDQFREATLFFHIDNPHRKSYLSGANVSDYPVIAMWCALCIWVVFVSKRQWKLWIPLWALAASLPFFGRMDLFRLWPSTMLLVTCIFILSGNSLVMRTTSWAMVCFSLVGALLVPPHYKDDFSKIIQISKTIQAIIPEDNTIWVAPFEPNIYCFTQKESVSRYYFILPWIAKPEVQEEILGSLKHNKPYLIVVLKNSYSLENLVPGIAHLIQQRYYLAKSDNYAEYYQLRSLADRAIALKSSDG